VDHGLGPAQAGAIEIAGNAPCGSDKTETAAATTACASATDVDDLDALLAQLEVE
jgi:hypothetical protein